MHSRPRRRTRRKTCMVAERTELPGAIIWLRRLLALSLIAVSNKTEDGFSPLCEAFVTPMRSSEIYRKSDRWRILGNENRNNQNSITAISSITIRSTRISTTLNASTHSDTTVDSNSKNKNSSSNGNKGELSGFILAIFIILSLAGMSGTSNGGADNTSTSVAVVTKVVENTVPTTSTEVVAVTLGESIGGVIGAIFSVAINFLLRGGKTNNDSSSTADPQSAYSNDKKVKDNSSLLSQGLSDSDYFIANSASNSILEAVGVPEAVAKYSSVFIAAIPSQLVKIGYQMSGEKILREEAGPENSLRKEHEPEVSDNSEAMLSLQESDKEENENCSPEIVVAGEAVGAAAASTTIATKESTAAVAVTTIDFVEVFADVTRWLEYDVLKTEYGETALSQLWMVENSLSINPVQSAITFALLGSLAAVSSRWYADILYGRFSYGPIEKQQEVRRRNNAEWFSIYSSTAASAATLFGCYEFFQLPIGRYIQGTLSGGIEGCFGSSMFDACMQTYIDTNSPGPSAEAQLRALLTNLYAVYIRLQDIAGYTTAEDVSALVRAWSVSFASYIANMS